MRDIEKTPLLTQGHRNTLRPCPYFNKSVDMMKLGKHTHKNLVFYCVDCGNRDIRNNNGVTHKTSNVCCRFCKLKNKHEKTMNNLIYDHVREEYGRAFEHIEIQKVIKRCQKDKFKYDMFLGEAFNNTVIELDDNTHIYNTLTRMYDIIKMQIAREKGYKVLRVYLNKNEEFTETLKKQIIKQLEINKTEESGYKLVILNDYKGKLTKLLTSI